mgnify:CR=1 FL=1
MYKEQKITVIIPCLNEEQGIEKVLTRMPAFVDEVIVVDNNSTDNTAELARQAGARVVFEPINQIGRARNAGAAQATGHALDLLPTGNTWFVLDGPNGPLFTRNGQFQLNERRELISANGLRVRGDSSMLGC